MDQICLRVQLLKLKNQAFWFLKWLSFGMWCVTWYVCVCVQTFWRTLKM